MSRIKIIFLIIISHAARTFWFRIEEPRESDDVCEEFERLNLQESSQLLDYCCYQYVNQQIWGWLALHVYCSNTESTFFFKSNVKFTEQIRYRYIRNSHVGLAFLLPTRGPKSDFQQHKQRRKEQNSIYRRKPRLFFMKFHFPKTGFQSGQQGYSAVFPQDGHTLPIWIQRLLCIFRRVPRYEATNHTKMQYRSVMRHNWVVCDRNCRRCNFCDGGDFKGSEKLHNQIKNNQIIIIIKSTTYNSI